MERLPRLGSRSCSSGSRLTRTLQLVRTFKTLSLGLTTNTSSSSRQTPPSTASRLLLPPTRTLLAPNSGPSLVAIRQKSTAARTRRALRVPPHPDFVIGPAPSRDGRSAKKSRFLPGPDEVLFHPPAAAPSVYHTPLKFVPASDPRRRVALVGSDGDAAASPVADIGELFRRQAQRTAAASAISRAPILGAAGTAAVQAKKQLSEAEVAEMRRLRAADPARWTVRALARHFGAGEVFVMIATRGAAPANHLAEMQERLDRVRARWGVKKSAARTERARRRVMMGRGEL